MNDYKRMRDYTHEEFINIISNMSEEELLEFSANYGGYPVLFRMSLDERVCHIPFIQTGSAIIIENENKEILLQERTDRNMWGLPGGCQDLGEQLEETAIREAKEETGLNLNKEDLVLIDTLSGNSRKNSYPNGDIVYNNTSTDLFGHTRKQRHGWYICIYFLLNIYFLIFQDSIFLKFLKYILLHHTKEVLLP